MTQSVEIFLSEVKNAKGKPGGWPGCFEYHFSNGQVRCSLRDEVTKANLRRMDPWGLLFACEAETRTGTSVREIVFDITIKSDAKKKASARSINACIESFLRRLSFLAFNNTFLGFSLIVDGAPRKLYRQSELLDRPTSEIIEEDPGPRADDDEPGRLEKDFQAYLFWKGKTAPEERTNERLAILGEDFYGLQKKNFKITRELPTGVFYERKSEETRILPTNFIDIVTLNKWGNPAIIELKLNDSRLEVISQILDYALFCRGYFKQWIRAISKAALIHKRTEIHCYVANNLYHAKFEKILKFYSTEGKGYGFILKKVVLGHTERL